jgi:hypothetical protein
MKGKYDGRRHSTFKVRHKGGRKPLWLKDLGIRHNIAVLEAFDEIVEPAALYRQAYAKKDLALCWDMRKHVECRILGKPFVAVNPDLKAPNGSVLGADQRLQLAVNTMIVQAPVIKGKRTRKQLANDPQDIRGELIEASSAVSQGSARNADSKDFVGFDDVVL